MDKGRSLYLEILRIIAAFYVFIYHFGSEPVQGIPFFVGSTSHISNYINWYGAHFFVIIFFVLSGFLITMSAHKKGMTLKSFLIARLGRLYSVVIPALIFTYLVSGVLSHAGYKLDNDDNLLSRFFINILFLTQSWNLCAMPPADGPFWSVSYEFMYYLIFGIFILTQRPLKIMLLIIVLVLAGPKILLLFPSWLVGSILFYLSEKRHIFNGIVSFFVFIATLLIIIHSISNPYNFPFLEPNEQNKIGNYTLFFSWNYKADYIFSLLIAINIYSFFGFSNRITKLLERNYFAKSIDLIYKAGNCTFTLYLFHLPIMFFLVTIFGYNKLNGWHNITLIITTLSIVYLIARVTEWKVFYWRQLVAKCFNLLFENSFFKKSKSISE